MLPLPVTNFIECTRQMNYVSWLLFAEYGFQTILICNTAVEKPEVFTGILFGRFFNIDPDYLYWILKNEFAPLVKQIVRNALQGIFPEKT